MKKIIALVLTAILVISMSACVPKTPELPYLGEPVSESEVSGANAEESAQPTQPIEPKEVESPMANNSQYITVTLEDELIISYPVTFSVDTKAKGMLLSVAQPEGSNIIVSSQEIVSDGLDTALSEQILKSQLEAQGSHLLKYQQVVCGNGYGAKLWARSAGKDGSERNQMVFVLINSSKTKAYYVILTTRDNNFENFGGTENYLLLK